MILFRNMSEREKLTKKYFKKMEEGLQKPYHGRSTEEHEDLRHDNPRNQSGHRRIGCVQILQGQMVN